MGKDRVGEKEELDGLVLGMLRSPDSSVHHTFSVLRIRSGPAL